MSTIYKIIFCITLTSDLFLIFSYDAAEDNELSFREGDRIIEIEAASEDWWQGKDKHGNVGLFPGMYFLIRSLFRCHSRYFLLFS